MMLKCYLVIETDGSFSSRTLKVVFNLAILYIPGQIYTTKLRFDTLWSSREYCAVGRWEEFVLREEESELE